MRKFSLRIAVVWTAAFFQSIAFAANIYVSRSGSDSNDGSSASPYRTVTNAYAKAHNGDTIVIRKGLFLENDPSPPLLFSKRVNFVPENGKAVVTLNIPPPNDHSADALPLSGTSATAYGANYSATTNLTEPRHAGQQGGRSVWYSWMAPLNGEVLVTVTSDEFVPLLGVYTGVGSSLDAVPSLDSPRPWNQLRFNAEAGVTYRIAVDGYKNGWGTFLLELNVDFASLADNDNFADAVALGQRYANAQGSSFHANVEPGERDHAGQAAGHSVWWKWTAPTNSTVGSRPVTISTAGSDFDTVLAVYSGASVNNLTELASNDDAEARCTAGYASPPHQAPPTFWLSMGLERAPGAVVTGVSDFL